MLKIKIYVCYTGTWDEEIELVTTNLKEAFKFCDESKRLIDLREYEVEINQHSFTRPERPKNLNDIIRIPG